MKDGRKKGTLKDRPVPRRLDGAELERWLERHCGFRPFGAEW